MQCVLFQTGVESKCLVSSSFFIIYLFSTGPWLVFIPSSRLFPPLTCGKGTTFASYKKLKKRSLVIPPPFHRKGHLLLFSLSFSELLPLKLMSTIPYYDHQALEFAKGTLDLRKQRNRKRTVTGEYVWSEEADLVFALGRLYIYPLSLSSSA